MWIEQQPKLREEGGWEEGVETAVALFAEANEDPAAFRTTSTYHVVSVRRSGDPRR